jgi:hypothetical protein
MATKIISVELIGKTVKVPKMSFDRDRNQNFAIISQILSQFLLKVVTLKYINPNDNISLASDEKVDEDIWICDSGASAHYCMSTNSMFNLKDINEKIMVGNGKKISQMSRYSS